MYFIEINSYTDECSLAYRRPYSLTSTFLSSVELPQSPRVQLALNRPDPMDLAKSLWEMLSALDLLVHPGFSSGTNHVLLFLSAAKCQDQVRIRRREKVCTKPSPPRVQGQITLFTRCCPTDFSQLQMSSQQDSFP